MNKKGFEFNFAWMFAIIIGAVIIFIAVYAATKLVGTGEKISDSEVGKQIGILLTPVETGIEEGKTSTITLIDESEISNICSDLGNFGSQKIKVGNGVPSTFYNKYIFSEDKISGKNLYILTMPFKMPFKVADLTIVYSENERHCLIKAQEDIRKEIEGFGLKNIYFVESADECPVDSKITNFASGVNMEDYNQLERDGQTIYYDSTFGNALHYAAIFSSTEVYECQVKRLMKRASELAMLYNEKSKIISSEGCTTNLETELKAMVEKSGIESSAEISEMVQIATEVESKNDEALCKLF